MAAFEGLVNEWGICWLVGGAGGGWVEVVVGLGFVGLAGLAVLTVFAFLATDVDHELDAAVETAAEMGVVASQVVEKFCPCKDGVA